MIIQVVTLILDMSVQKRDIHFKTHINITKICNIILNGTVVPANYFKPKQALSINFF